MPLVQLHVDEYEVVAGRLGDAGDLGGAAEPHRHAEGDAARGHTLLDRIDQLHGRHGNQLPCVSWHSGMKMSFQDPGTRFIVPISFMKET